MSATSTSRPAPGQPPRELGNQANSQWPGGHPRRRQILLVLCLSLLAVVIDNTILNTAPLPTWPGSCTRAPARCSGSPTPTRCASPPCWWRPARSATASGGGSRCWAASPSSPWAASRPRSPPAPSHRGPVVMGLGATFVMPATLSILNAVFPPKERPQAIAAWSAVAYKPGHRDRPHPGRRFAAHVFPGGAASSSLTLPVALAIAGVIWTVPETAEPGGHGLDIVGTLLIASTAHRHRGWIIEAPTRGWTAPATLAEIAAGLGALGVFAWWELRIAHPLIDLEDLRLARLRGRGLGDRHLRALRQPVRPDQYLQLVHGYSPLSALLCSRRLPWPWAPCHHRPRFSPGAWAPGRSSPRAWP